MKIAFASSVPYKKTKLQIVSRSPNGSVSTNVEYKLFVRDKTAHNSAVAGKDVKINNVSKYVLKKSTTDNIQAQTIKSYTIPNLPIIIQGDNPNCQILPFLQQIQSQLDFPIDFGAFLACLPFNHNMLTLDPSMNIPEDWYNIPDSFLDPMTFGYVEEYADYVRLTALLFSDDCRPVPQGGVHQGCKNQERLTDIDKMDSDCATSFKSKGDGYALGADPCADKYKFELQFPENPVTTNKQIVELLDQNIPVALPFGEDAGKALAIYWLMRQKHFTFGGKEPTIEDILNYPDFVLDSIAAQFELLYPELNFLDKISGNMMHAATIIGYNGPDSEGCYEFIVRNSWSIPELNTIPIKSCNDQLITDLLTDKVAGVPYQLKDPYFQLMGAKLIATKCEDGISCSKDEECQGFGFDKENPGVLDRYPTVQECPCECKEVDATNNLDLNVNKSYSEELGRCVCQSDDETMYCPEGFSVDPETCDCVENVRYAWCDCQRCENDQLFKTGTIKTGTYEEYLADPDAGSTVITLDMNLSQEERSNIIYDFLNTTCTEEVIECEPQTPPSTPTPVPGVCCDPIGQCSTLYSDQTDCENAGGTWYDNVTCEDITCTPPPYNL